MPVLAEAQQRESGVTFLFVNQGEGARTVSDYLTEHGLWLENVLLDSGSRLGARWAPACCPPRCSTTPTGSSEAAIWASCRAPAWLTG